MPPMPFTGTTVPASVDPDEEDDEYVDVDDPVVNSTHADAGSSNSSTREVSSVPSMGTTPLSCKRVCASQSKEEEVRLPSAKALFFRFPV